MQYDKETLKKIVDEFKAKQPLFKEFGENIEVLVKEKLKETNISDHIISSRPKSVESFSRKIQRKNYRNPLIDITDLTGVRVSVCYTDQIKLIEDILFGEFDIDQENSIDRSKIYEANTFGYLSVHYIIYNSQSKSKDIKWSKFNGIKAEIQLRTTLQHAWALVNHALYKNESEVPQSLWRRLNRLSGLFELADQEFIEIRKLNEKYKLELIDEFEKNQTDKIEINYYSLNEYIARNQVVITATKAARDSNQLLDESLQKEYYNKIDSSSITEVCRYFEINTIKDLATLIDENKKWNIDFIKNIAKGNIWKFTKPFILFLLILKAKYKDFPIEYLTKKYGWEVRTINFVIGEAKKLS